MAPSLAAWHLGAELRNQRTAAGLTVREMIYELQCSDTTLANYESGKSIARVPVVKSICSAAAADSRTVSYLTGLARHCVENGSAPMEEQQQLHPDLRCLARAEQEYGDIRQWEPLYLPGLLQIEPYHHMICEAETQANAFDPVAMWELKRSRQKAHASKPPASKTEMVLGRAALDILDESDFGEEQTEHLLKCAQSDTFDIRVVPGVSSGMRGSFYLLRPGDQRFNAGPPFVYYETLHTAYYVTRQDVIAVYEAAYQEIISKSVPLEEWIK